MPKAVEPLPDELRAIQEQFLKALRGQPIDELARIVRQLRHLQQAAHPEAQNCRKLTVLPADLAQRTNRQHIAVWRAIGKALDTLAQE